MWTKKQRDKQSELLKKAHLEGRHKAGFTKGNTLWDNPICLKTQFKKGHPNYNPKKKGLFKKGGIPWNKGLKGYMSGENNPAFNNWSSRLPYSKEFSPELKLQIRQRDNFRCRECNFTEEQLGYKLRIHHIDYNKKNNNPNNLISLCKSCHSKTGFNREDWEKYFKEKKA